MEILKVHETLEDLKKFTQWAKTADVLQEDPNLRTDQVLAESETQK